MTYRELKRSDLLEALYALEREEDINRVTRYFSYEHFYVIYCKFWELDSDHDFLLSRDDLARYSNCALTFQVVNRIFDEVGCVLWWLIWVGEGAGRACIGARLGAL
jgi:serine/threonine-protein phosphatase 2A regulatory subunit B''